MEEETIIIVSVFAAAWAVLFLIVVVLCIQVGSLRRLVRQMQATGRIRVQKLKMDSDQNHAFHNATISPDEELSRRGYSMYVANGDPEAGRPTERQTGGQLVDEINKEIEHRQQRQSNAPPFLLQAIEENKRRSRSSGLKNPVARKSDTDNNFIY